MLTKVALSLLAASLVPLAIVPWLWRVNVEALQEQVLRTHALAARSTADRSAALLQSLATAAETLAASPELRTTPLSAGARDLLSGLLQARPEVAALTVEDAQGRELVRVQARAQAAAAAEILALPLPGAWVARRRQDGPWVRLDVPLASADGRLRLVALVAGLDELTRPEELGDEAQLALFDTTGTPLAGPGVQRGDFPAAMREGALSGRLSGAARFRGDEAGGDVLGAWAPVPGTPFHVLSRQPAAVAEAVAGRMRRRSLLALGAALGLVVLLSLLAQRNVIQPLRELVRAQQRLIHGAGRARTADEIDELRHSFALLEGQARDREALGSVFLGRYLVIDVIASGGMGTVFRGWDPRLQRPVALKTVRLDQAVPGAPRTQLVTSLLQEAVTVARLNHPHIVAVYDVEDLAEAAFIAMELVDGPSLADHLAELGRLSAAQVAPLGAAVARGLDAAHAGKIVHRDMKPANVLLARDGAIKVTDFGIAAMLSALAGPSRLVFGTPGYLPPEALRGEGQGVSGDLFALGVIFYECLSGERLYWGDRLTEVTRRTLDEPVTPLRVRRRDIPQELDALVLALLDKRPERRPASAHEVARDLERLASREGWEWVPPVVPEDSVRPRTSLTAPTAFVQPTRGFKA